MPSIAVKGTCTRADPFISGKVSAEAANAQTHKVVTLIMSQSLADSLGLALDKERDVTVEATPLPRNASAYQIVEPQPSA